MADFKETSVIPRLLCTAVGSLPHSDPDTAVDLILNSLTAGAAYTSIVKSLYARTDVDSGY